jgi:hypothetical protein
MPAHPANGGRAADGSRVDVMTFRQLAAAIRSRDAGREGIQGCRVVGVDGMSGAGKTGFARRLAAELAAPCLSTDDLVPGWDGLADSVGLLVGWVLRPLSAGQRARWQRYDWLAGRPGEWEDLAPSDFLVVEGCCVGLPAAAAYLSYLVWIDTPAAERRLRLERRGDWDGYAPFARRWARQETDIQSGASTAERADLVVDNSERTGGQGWAEPFACRPTAR